MNNPVRTCIVCRREFSKGELLRIVKTPDGNFAIDPTGKLNGRGAYVCKSQECVAKLKKTRQLNRAFKQEVPDEVYIKAEEAVIGSEK